MEITEFKQIIFDHYLKHGRSFPWRETKDPYAITVSEIMLQQTQTDRVVPKYQAFLSALPNWQALSEVNNAELFTLWQGLGYNRRALSLKKMAQVVVEKYAGLLPHTQTELVSLPGIGPYTSGAILAFAFNIPVPVIETNIRRVYIHHFFAPDSVVSDKDLMPLIEATLDADNPREWYYALMDYGSQLAKTLPNPNRRSLHYVKQGKLAGSNREVRGAILRVLTQHQKLTYQELVNETKIVDDRVAPAYAQMLAEGFIIEDAGSVALS